MRYLATLLLFFASLSTFAQNISEFQLSWDITSIFSPEGEAVKTLSFAGASIDSGNNWLPEFSHLQKTGSAGELFSVELTDTEYQMLSSGEMQILKNKSLPDQIVPEIKEVVIRKESYQQVRFVPIRKNAITGRYEKLVRFALRFKSQGIRKSAPKLKSYASTSVLQSGQWFKIAVDTSAIHKITYSQLLEMGIENPAQVRIYGYGGGMLPEINTEEIIDDLPLVPIFMETGNDGIFNSGDYLLFYAQGPRSWKYDESSNDFVHENHLYSDRAHYFITSDLGNPSLVQTTVPEASFSATVDEFDDFRVVDSDEVNLLESGRLWLGQEFDIAIGYDFSFHFPNLNKSEPVSISASLVGRSSSNTEFILQSGNSSIGEINIPAVNTGSYTTLYAALEQDRFTNFRPSSDNFTINLTYEKSSPSSVGWLNFLRINARRNLIFNGDQMAFRDSRSVGAGNNTKFRIQNCTGSTLVWDVTEAQSTKQIPLQITGSTGEFNVGTSGLKEFIVFDPNGNFPSPELVGSVPNQNLHALPQIDMIIVSPLKFISYAGQIADFHRNHDNLKVVIAALEAIYNEFSSGTPDVSAIRNFVKMFYDRAASEADMPKYLLLFGDGSFDNKSDTDNNTDQILTYQSESSLNPTESFVTDDFFGLLDDGEGGATGMIDIGIGRLPVNTADEAQIVANKIINYNNSERSDWRTTVCFIGDDEDNNIHMRDANRLAEKLEDNHPSYRIQRIFLDDFEQVTSSAGQEYPDVNRKINESVNKGALLMNYTGHGNENGLAHERVLMLDDILSWKNPEKLPLFMTATCEFSRFDNYKKTSAGEIVLLRENGGGIGLFTTTRLVFSSLNFNLNNNFCDHVFEKDVNGEYNRLGDIMRKTKNATVSVVNKRNFTLLGDPALSLNYPAQTAVTQKVNNVDITQVVDTLKALSKVSISGAILSDDGEELSNFSGTLFPTVFDKPSTKTTRGNDGDPFEYKEQVNILYKGKASVTNGKFNFSFFVPKDINYQYGNGKVSYYANGANTDAAGFTNTIVVGGTNPNASDDKTGPEIEMYMNDEQFSPGGMTGADPLFLAIVQDSSGINTVGHTIGHDIVAVLDQKTDQPIELNDFYESDLDSYQKGKITYQLTGLEIGEHELHLKLWDNTNNSSEGQLEFIVAESAELVIKNLLNYPNPFTTNTGFYFEHNQVSRELDVLIQILTISGKLIKTIETNIASANNRVGPIQWDGKDDFGNSIGRGVYFYRVKVRSDDGKVVNKFQKLVILK